MFRTIKVNSKLWLVLFLYIFDSPDKGLSNFLTQCKQKEDVVHGRYTGVTNYSVRRIVKPNCFSYSRSHLTFIILHLFFSPLVHRLMHQFWGLVMFFCESFYYTISYSSLSLWFKRTSLRHPHVSSPSLVSQWPYIPYRYSLFTLYGEYHRCMFSVSSL